MTGKAYYESLPKKRMGAGVLFFDNSGGILMVKPNYKDHWTIPGGVVNKDESPKQAAEREVAEEIGLKKKVKKLLAVSYNKAIADANESLQWLFLGGGLTDEEIKKIKLQKKELDDFKFLDPKNAIKVAEPALRKRLVLYKKILESKEAVYLENWEEVLV